MKRRSPLVRNVTTPSRVAKIVSSLPIPVPGPGRNRVPRWRTRIIPDDTSCPENIFTPSIFGFESPPCAGPDRLDLDLGQAAAEACVLPVAGPPLVPADADLVAQHMADDPRGDRRRGRQIGVAVAADEQDAGAERLPLVGLQPIDE